MENKVRIIAVIFTLLGLSGIGQTVWFYVTGTKSPIPSAAITLDWPSFALYLNFFVPGIIIGPGMRTRTALFRILGLIMSVVWALGTVFAIILSLFDLTQYPNPQTTTVMLLVVTLLFGFLGYCVWQFTVLRAAESIKYFSDVD